LIALGNEFGNALGKSLADLTAMETKTGPAETFGSNVTARLTGLNFADNEYGRLRARLTEYGPDARADFPTDEELAIYERAADDNGGVLPKSPRAIDESADELGAAPDESDIQKVVVTVKRWTTAQKDVYESFAHSLRQRYHRQ
jgi:hypothetical protein